MTHMPEPRYVDTNGIRMAVHEVGSGFPVVLLHGWPELARSWRHQVPALAAAGYRVIAPDQRGYGLTDCPQDVEAYDMAHLLGDLVGLLDALDIERAVFAGHDWGGLLVWQMPLFHRERVAGVIGVNSPFLPRLPLDPITMMRAVYSERMYILSFHASDAPDRLMARDVDRTFRTFMRSLPATPAALELIPPEFNDFDFLSQLDRPEPAVLPGQPLLSEEDHQAFVEAFERTGFSGGLNWYRNLRRNWEACAGVEQKVTVPSLMISAEYDTVLSPALTNGMEAYVPDLEKHLIPGCGHWTQHEKPEELNAIMIDWLHRRFPV